MHVAYAKSAAAHSLDTIAQGSFYQKNVFIRSVPYVASVVVLSVIGDPVLDSKQLHVTIHSAIALGNDFATPLIVSCWPYSEVRRLTDDTVMISGSVCTQDGSKPIVQNRSKQINVRCCNTHMVPRHKCLEHPSCPENAKYATCCIY